MAEPKRLDCPQALSSDLWHPRGRKVVNLVLFVKEASPLQTIPLPSCADLLGGYRRAEE